MRFGFCILTLLFLAGSATAQGSFDSKQLATDLRLLSADSLEGRKTGTAGAEKARIYIINRLSEIGINPFGENYLQPFSVTQSFGRVQSGDAVNILGVISGKTSKTIVVSAHYDHVGVTNNEIYNGADDNASGVAALLAIAQYFKKNTPQHRIILAFFDAEEMGLKGSSHFVSTVNLKQEEIILNVNMDMISRNDNYELYACGTHHYPFLKNPLQQITLPEKMKLSFGYDSGAGRADWTYLSDQGNFHRKKIPFIYFAVEDHNDYHKPTDDFEKVNLDFYSRSVETILRSIVELDKGF